MWCVVWAFCGVAGSCWRRCSSCASQVEGNSLVFLKQLLPPPGTPSKLFSASRLLVPSLPPWTLPDRSCRRLSCARLRHSGCSFLGVALRECWHCWLVRRAALWWRALRGGCGRRQKTQWCAFDRNGLVAVVRWSQASWEAGLRVVWDSWPDGNTQVCVGAGGCCGGKTPWGTVG